MAGNKKISELSTAGTLTGTELVEIVQSGGNVKTTTQLIANLGAAGSGITGNIPVGNLLRVATIDEDGNVLTVEASHIYESSTSCQMYIDSPSAYYEVGVLDTITGDVAGFQAQPTYAKIAQKGSAFVLFGEEAFLTTTSVPFGGAGIIGVDAAGKLFTTTGASGTFTSNDGKTITVSDGTITSIV